MFVAGKSLSLTGLAALSLALAGCTTVGPDFTPPATPTAQRYLSTAGAPHPSDRGPDAVKGEGPVLDWWKAFGSSELDAMVARAIENNASLEASNATLAAAREQVAAARGRELPQVDANAEAAHRQANLAAEGFDTGALPGIDATPTFDLYSVGGGVSYDLDLFGKQRRRVERAAAQAEAQYHQTQAAHLAIAGQVVNQVLLIATIRERIATAETLLDEDRRNIDLTEKRRRAGEGTLVEVLNARSQFEADRGEIPQLGQQLAEARHLLATLVGVSPAELGATDFDLAELTLPQQVPVALPSRLVHKRPDILQAEADLHAATAEIGVATANLYPDITLGATLTQASPDLFDALDPGSRGFNIFAGLTAPIFHGGTLKAEKRAAVKRAEAAAATYRQTVLDGFRQVADLLSALQNDQRSVSQQQESVDVAQRSLHLSRRSFEVGNSGVLQVLDSERLYQRAQSALVEARARQYLNVARLYVATAGGWTGDMATGDAEMMPVSDNRP
ncbi:efflux transporter outer membrane subunit [Stakelama saccharophila]|uniref:Efflux transporter outer membrane subunit n=1 Tax=Stakelama saccharophila TaxID=3075605 RepID=A0ABZ0BAQ5_9SPHN|nr:efflux transporter outer membrane subunit [Stakelama sp. W311]WNO54500.1 efflux transporter outer membrane subunit [Stakelama sp. W311]